MQDIAEQAGVSLSTVSRALHDNPRIGVRTRDRIHRIAADLGYRPNPMVAALMKQLRTNRPVAPVCNLAWLDFYEDPEAWKQSAVQRGFYAGALARARARNYSLERIQVCAPGMTPSRLNHILESRGIRAVLMSWMRDSDGISSCLPFDLNRFAVISVGTRYQRPDLSYASDDQYISSCLAIRRLWELGYRRIGYVGEPGIERIVENRFSAGYLTTLTIELGGTTLPPLFTFDDVDVVEWWHRFRPDAILTSNRLVLRNLRQHGIRVPEDVGLAHLNIEDCADYAPAELAGIKQDNERVGEGAVDFLISQISTNAVGPPEIPRGVLTPSLWVEGPTVRQVTVAASDQSP